MNHNKKISKDDFDQLTGLLMIKNRAYIKIIKNKENAGYYYQIINLIDDLINELVNENIDEMNEIIDAILEFQVEIFKSINDSFELMDQKKFENEEI